MNTLNHMATKAGLAALLAAAILPTTAFAGEQARAEAAIAEAKGKIDSGDKMGVGDQAPELQGQARQALMTALDLLKHHKKMDALAEAHHASDLADEAIISANSRKSSAERDRRDNLREATSAAQQSAATANMRADNAEQATTTANIRANAAEQSSAEANAQATALRNTPPVPVMPSTTTVAVTENVSAEPVATPTHHMRHKALHHKVTHRHVRVNHIKTTTTTVTTNHP